MAKLRLDMVLLGAALLLAAYPSVEAQQQPVLQLFAGGESEVIFFVPVGAEDEYALSFVTNTVTSNIITGSVDTITATLNGGAGPPERIVATEAPEGTTITSQATENVYEFQLVSTGNDTVTVEQYETLLSNLRYISLLPNTSLDDPPRNITVFASGPGGVSETSTVLLQLLVSNQFAPVIMSRIVVSVRENTPNGATFAQLNATDPEGHDVVFALQPPSTVFAVTLSGVLMVLDSSSLDFENATQNPFELTVVATDTDPIAPMSSDATLIINIENVNDLPPRFTSAIYFFSVTEEVANAEVGTVAATDDDQDPNTNTFGNVFFDIQDTTAEIVDNFNINRGTGVITVRSGLDFEEVTSYSFQVTATDGMFVDVATVQVAVIDVPDDRPVISPAEKTILINLDVNQREVFLTTGTGGLLMVSDSDSPSLQDGVARLAVGRGALVSIKSHEYFGV